MRERESCLYDTIVRLIDSNFRCKMLLDHKTILFVGNCTLHLDTMHDLPLHVDGVLRPLSRGGPPMKVKLVEHVLPPEKRFMGGFSGKSKVRNIVKGVFYKPYCVHVTDLSRVEPAVATEGTSLPSRGRAGWKTTVCPLLVIVPLMSSKYALGRSGATK